jgi:hypothetical protein
MLKTMASALLPWQQADGFWRASITDPTNPLFDNPETSATGFFTYAIAYGINEGLLADTPEANYTKAVTMAWEGMVSTALHPNGRLGYVQAVGTAPNSADFYSERDYGYGAFLLAGSEILRMIDNSPAGGIVVSASGYQLGHPPGNTLDKRLDTRWSQDGADGSQWIQFALPTPCAMDHVDIAFYLGNLRQARFAIWLSMDGAHFNRVLPDSSDSADYVSSSGTSLDLQTFSFPDQIVKSVRIFGWGNSSNTWNSFTEVGIPISVNP